MAGELSFEPALKERVGLLAGLEESSLQRAFDERITFMGTSFLGEVPLHMSIRETSDEGTPVTATRPESDEAKIFARIAEKLSNILETDTPKAAPKIVID